MPLSIPHTFAADTDALASDVNDVNAAIAAKFSETAGVGIGDGDVASDAGISGSKLSNVTGKQIPTDRLADDAVTAAKLADSASVDANRAVTTNHIRDAAVTKPKIGPSQITLDKHAGPNGTSATVVQVVAFSQSLPASASSYVVSSIERRTSAGNYIARLRVRTISGGVEAFTNIDVTPTVAIPAATAEILAMYLDNLALAGSAFSGNVVFVALLRT